MSNNSVELGCGLIGIGRTWGYKETPIPSQEEALAFLDSALLLSIRYFDTAPSYGLSEERVGLWLRTLSSQQRESITIATKFGEHWSTTDQKAYVDHSFEALQKSIDQSIQRLGNIDVLQLHKTSPQVLRSDDFQRALEYARSRGIVRFGASVSDMESGEIVCRDDTYELIQLPFNQKNTQFVPLIEEASKRGKTVVTNRPFNMGEVVHVDVADENREDREQEAFVFILKHVIHGFVLTGTKSLDHLRENAKAFYLAKYNLD